MKGEAQPGGAPRAPRRRRLSRSAEFERVYRQGRSKSNRYLILYVFPRAGQSEARGVEHEGPRLGLSVSRRVGGAVTRTHVKRVIREAFWAEALGLSHDADYVVVARPDAGLLAERDGLSGIRPALAELVDQVGGRRAHSESSAGASS